MRLHDSVFMFDEGEDEGEDRKVKI